MPLSDEDKAEIGKLFGDLLKGDDFKEALGGVVDSRVGTAIKSLKLDDRFKEVSSTVEELKTKATEKPEEKPADTGGKGGAGDGVESDPAFRKLQTQYEEMQRKLQAEETARKQAEEARKQERLNNGIQAALSKHGVQRVKHAMAFLRQEGVLDFTADGEPGLKFTRSWGDEIVPAEKALEEWLKSDDGKAYLPATNTQGTGEGSGKRPTAPPRREGQVDWGSLQGRVLQGVAEADVLDA